MKKKFAEFKKLLDKSNKIAIFGHEYIDGDCIGACFALGEIFSGFGKKISYFVSTKPSSIYSFIEGIERFNLEFDYEDYDLMLYLDIPIKGRIGKIYNDNPEYFIGKKSVVIDHHRSTEDFATLDIKSIKASSTCEILYDLIDYLWSGVIDYKVATLLYYGIIYDTGNLIYDCTSDYTIDVINNLVKLGADRNYVNENFIVVNTYQSIKFTGMQISRMKRKGDILYTYFSKDDIDQYGISRFQSKYILDVWHTIKDVDVRLTFSKIGDLIKCSVRSTNPVSHLIGNFMGGGGSKNTAGFAIKLEGEFLDQIEKIVNKISDYYDEIIKEIPGLKSAEK